MASGLQLIGLALQGLDRRPTFTAGNYSDEQIEEATRAVQERFSELNPAQFRNDDELVKFLQDDILTRLQKGIDKVLPDPAQVTNLLEEAGSLVPGSTTAFRTDAVPFTAFDAEGDRRRFGDPGTIDPGTDFGRNILVNQAQKVGVPEADKFAAFEPVNESEFFREIGPPLVGTGLALTSAGTLGTALGALPATSAPLAATPATPATTLPATVSAGAAPTVGTASVGEALATPFAVDAAGGIIPAAGASGGLGTLPATTSAATGGGGLLASLGLPEAAPSVAAAPGVGSSNAAILQEAVGEGILGGEATKALTTGGFNALDLGNQGLFGGVIEGTKSIFGDDFLGDLVLGGGLIGLSTIAQQSAADAAIDAQKELLAEQQSFQAEQNKLAQEAALKRALAVAEIQAGIAKRNRIQNAFTNLMDAAAEGRAREAAALNSIAANTQGALLRR